MSAGAVANGALQEYMRRVATHGRDEPGERRQRNLTRKPGDDVFPAWRTH